MAKRIYTDFDLLGVSRLQNVPAPQAGGDASNKDYVDSLVEGLAWKDAVRVSTQGNLNLSAPGATIDGITMDVNDRFLVRAQTDDVENGIYIFNGAAIAATRSSDADTSDKLEQAVTGVQEGTNAGVQFRQNTVNFTIDVDAIIWTTFGTSAPSASETTAGLIEIATQAEVDAGSDTVRAVTPATLASALASGLAKYSTQIGDGSATSYVVTHNLATRDVAISIYETAGTYAEIEAQVEHTTVNTATIVFTVAPTSNQFTVIVIG